ncbi:MAG: hypothetical protein IT531_14230 [Burkholderiales bacterium]|nr:hypothetical protein [Burkholderiales bacterium]
MNAEAADIDAVMVAGHFVKRDGKLAFPEARLHEPRAQALESRLRLMAQADYAYAPFPRGPLPERYLV